MASWWVEYSLEAANYLADNGELVAALFFALEAMVEHDGWPQIEVTELNAGLFAFEVEGHIVAFRRNQENALVMVEVIKPLK